MGRKGQAAAAATPVAQAPQGPAIGGPSWYTDAATYWGTVNSDVQGMLGGFGHLTEIDCKSSIEFIDEFVNGKQNGSENVEVPPRIGKGLACDCGAGIGRVSKHFLLKVFERVDMVEQTPKFLKEAEDSYMGQDLVGRVDRFIPKGLQDFTPDEGRYDLIWTQWVLGHLTDEDFVAFFQKCKRGLKPNGLIGVKENVTRHGVLVDAEDSSVTRSDAILKELFTKAGLKVIKEDVQKGFPPQLFGVNMLVSMFPYSGLPLLLARHH
ncbi:alpha-N-methyltransferase NTM1 [Fimicolochytrium jonesii]|uniref:alpha-N-methyltransferase NTM1 n=1 Tax=Fimicolochytrium jonesii TaxID=1396493 RepID=UPI0022FE48CF|nr:alpha-N-methyltransferase NTM1 [Fimicolochytrium jonesii]KAI8819836.1 alpha-N-methyltransferase NTM1 [Fimicolochytrium jonesii]